MFNCDMCHQPIGPSIPSVRIVVATRPKVYPRRVDANHGDTDKARNDPGGRGREIAEEGVVCPGCAP